MVKKSADKAIDIRQMFGGRGQAKMFKLLDGPEAMYGKGRIFNHVVLEPGCEVGWHIHKGDGETYYILKGKGEYNDNGTTLEVGPGDVTFVDDGEGHALYNPGPEDLEAIALVLYKG